MDRVVFAITLLCVIGSKAHSQQINYKPGRFYFPLQISVGRDPYQFSYASLVQTSVHSGVGYALSGTFRVQLGATANKVIPHLHRPSSTGVPNEYDPNRYAPSPVWVGPEISLTYMAKSSGSIHFYSTIGTSWQKCTSEHKWSFYGAYLDGDHFRSASGRFTRSLWISFAEMGIHIAKRTIVNNIGLRYSYAPVIYRGYYIDITDSNWHARQIPLPGDKFEFNQGYVSLVVTKTFGRGYDYGKGRSLRR
jgi:hypothetical protein